MVRVEASENPVATGSGHVLIGAFLVLGENPDSAPSPPRATSLTRVVVPGLEVGQGGEHPAVVGGFGEEPQLGEDGGYVGLDGLGVDEQLLGDGLVRPTLGQESRTSRSRGDSGSTVLRRVRRPSSRLTISGSTAEPPAATRRRASANSLMSATRSLSR